VVTNSAELFEKMKALRGHGAKVKYRHELVGGNFRLDAMQAAVLRVKLPHLATWAAQRAANANRYRALFSRGSTPDLRLPPNDPRHTYNQFVVRTGRRDELKAHLAEVGVQTEVYYPLPFHSQPCFAGLNARAASFPVSAAAAADSLALPVSPGLTAEQIAFVVDSVQAFPK
jgi:dTDP-4-amino-4,6-dideoxygalactose transaminase